MDTCVGKVTHYYNRISVAVVELSGDVKIGDTILFLGRTTDFTQKLTSMEINHQKIPQAGAGTEIAIKVEKIVRAGDQLYKAEPSEYEPFA